MKTTQMVNQIIDATKKKLAVATTPNEVYNLTNKIITLSDLLNRQNRIETFAYYSMANQLVFEFSLDMGYCTETILEYIYRDRESIHFDSSDFPDYLTAEVVLLKTAKLKHCYELAEYLHIFCTVLTETE